MEILVLSHEEVERLLPMNECIELMGEALVALAMGEVHNPLRSVVKPPGEGHFLGLMPAHRGGDRAAYALKEVCIFPGNPARGLDAHQGAVLLHGGATGELLAVMNASAITAIRTAAVSGLATRTLARPDSETLAILGTGVQARAHVEAMSHAGKFRRARVCGRRPERARAFVEELAASCSFSLVAVDDAQSAVKDADVVVTATNSSVPVLRREWLSEGVHINAVGSSIPTARELDADTVAACRLFVDRRESTLAESGDYLFAVQEGKLGPDSIHGELGDVLVGRCTGRGSDSEMTLFKSLGLAVEDLACAQYLYEQARDGGGGSRVSF